MLFRLPKNKWFFIVATNIVWWILPFGINHEMSKNLSAYAPDPLADSLGIVIVPLFALWFILWIGLNLTLFIKTRNYPSGTSLLIWNTQTPFNSWFWTVTAFVFIANYFWNIVDQIQFDIGNNIISIYIYLPAAMYIIFSIYMRALMVAPKPSSH